MNRLLEKLLKQLQEEDLISDVALVRDSYQPNRQIWYLEIMLCAASFFAAGIFMSSFLVVGAFFDSFLAWMFQGALYLIAAWALYRIPKYSFFKYSGLAMSLGGLGSMLFGCMLLSENHELLVMFNGALCLLLFLFKDKILRLLWLSVFFANCGIWMGLNQTQLGLPMFVGIAMSAVIAIFGLTPRHAWRPAGYALAAVAMGLSIFGEFWEEEPIWWVTRVLVWTFMSALLWSLELGHGRRVARFWSVSALSLVAYVASPGLFLAFALVILGYAVREIRLFGFGSAAFVWTLVLYYYNMEVSLLWKSIYLMVVGSTLLLVRLVMTRFGRGIMKEVGHES